jgi:hypothetical protein
MLIALEQRDFTLRDVQGIREACSELRSVVVHMGCGNARLDKSIEEG